MKSSSGRAKRQEAEEAPRSLCGVKIKGDAIKVECCCAVVTMGRRPQQTYATVHELETATKSNVIHGLNVVSADSAKHNDVGDRSDATSTAASVIEAAEPGLFLTEAEKKEAKKIEKLLRGIAKLEQRMAVGGKLNQQESEKIARKQDLEAAPVMDKVRSGRSCRDPIALRLQSRQEIVCSSCGRADHPRCGKDLWVEQRAHWLRMPAEVVGRDPRNFEVDGDLMEKRQASRKNALEVEHANSDDGDESQDLDDDSYDVLETCLASTQRPYPTLPRRVSLQAAVHCAVDLWQRRPDLL